MPVNSRLVVPNVIYIHSCHPHTCRVYTSEPPTPIDFDFILFLGLPRWAAGRWYWKSGAAHTLGIYKTTNHWNHRNAVFHFPCQASCHADHTAVIQASKPRCTALSSPFFFDICFPPPSLFSSFNPRSLSFSFSCSLCLGFSSFHTFISPSFLCPSWATAQSGLTKSLPAKPAPVLNLSVKVGHCFLPVQFVSDWVFVICLKKRTKGTKPFKWHLKSMHHPGVSGIRFIFPTVICNSKRLWWESSVEILWAHKLVVYILSWLLAALFKYHTQASTIYWHENLECSC